MSKRPSTTAVFACCFAVLVFCSASAPVFAAPTGTVLISPAAADGVTAEVPIHLPARREAPADKASVLKSLNLLQPNAAGAITILVESVELSGDTPTVDDNDYTRIDNAVQAVAMLGDGTIVRLVGNLRLEGRERPRFVGCGRLRHPGPRRCGRCHNPRTEPRRCHNHRAR